MISDYFHLKTDFLMKKRQKWWGSGLTCSTVSYTLALPSMCHTCDMAKGIMHYFKWCLINKSTLHISKLPPPPDLLPCTVVAIQNELKSVISLDEVVTTFETTSTLQLVRLKLPTILCKRVFCSSMMQAKLLPIKFWGWKFHRWPRWPWKPQKLHPLKICT